MRLKLQCRDCTGQDCPRCAGTGYYAKVTGPGEYPEFIDNTEEQAIYDAADDSYFANYNTDVDLNNLLTLDELEAQNEPDDYFNEDEMYEKYMDNKAFMATLCEPWWAR